MQKPKLGLVDYMLRRFDPHTDRDIVFIPVGINYDRTIEDRSLLRGLEPDAEKRSIWFVFRTTGMFILRSIVLMMLSRWRRYGYACVNFGTPLSIKAYCREQDIIFSDLSRIDRFPEIEKLCQRLMGAVANILPVVPISLVSKVFLGAMDMEMDILDIEKGINHLIAELKECGAPVLDTARSTRARTIADAVDLMTLRGIVTSYGGKFKAVREEEAILNYYANAIEHWLS